MGRPRGLKVFHSLPFDCRCPSSLSLSGRGRCDLVSGRGGCNDLSAYSYFMGERASSGIQSAFPCTSIPGSVGQRDSSHHCPSASSLARPRKCFVHVSHDLVVRQRRLHRPSGGGCDRLVQCDNADRCPRRLGENPLDPVEDSRKLAVVLDHHVLGLIEHRCSIRKIEPVLELRCIGGGHWESELGMMCPACAAERKLCRWSRPPTGSLATSWRNTIHC